MDKQAHFYSADSVNNIDAFVNKAIDMKKNTASFNGKMKGKKMTLIFFNPSLRTRLSTEFAAQELGLHTISMNATEGWKWEIDDGVIMNVDKAEHIKDAAKVVSQYSDVIAIRSFPGLKDRDADYRDELIQNFMDHTTVPVINMESSIYHPLQSLTDMMTIKEQFGEKKLKVVLSWAPHPKALPQAVSNSFLQWINHSGHEVVVTHPEGYDLSTEFTRGCSIEHNQQKAMKDADVVYTKNWSSYTNYGQILSEDQSWMINKKKMSLTNNAIFMHCLPVRRNVVVTDGVMDSDRSVIYQQAGNRLHAAKAVIHHLLNR
jgi:N-succinyl-L-ornithine transcarbamylase